jgi:serine protease Do
MFAGAIGAVTLVALAWLAPATHGQSGPTWTAKVERSAPVIVEDPQKEEAVTRVLEVLGGRGSEIGVSIRDLPEADVRAGKTGVLIEDVRADSPAMAAGLKDGDIVTSFDGERVRSTRQFARLVQETPSGRPARTQVLRDGKPVDLTVTPSAGERAEGPRRFEFYRGGPAFRMELPDVPHVEIPEIAPEGFAPRAHVEPFMWARPGRLGVNVQSLTPELAEYFGVKEGVLVSSVVKDSPAAKAGLKAGDVITTVDGATIDDAGELRRRLPVGDTAAEVNLGVVRDRKSVSMKVPLEGPAKAEPPRPRRPV